MPKRADILVSHTVALQYPGGGTQYLVQTLTGVLYLIYGDAANDVVYRKSSNGGLSWSAPVAVFAGTVTAMSVWYDRWSGIAADLIHIAYTESGTHDTLYRTINTASSDALSTQTVIFAGISALAGGRLSITRAVGGNVYCNTTIDAGSEGGFFRLPNANVPNGAWDAARTNPEALATQDMMILVPGFAADNQDIMGIFWDVSANEISRYIHDDSANTWAETSIATGMTEQVAANGFPNFAATVDLTNSRIIMVAWSNVDLANSDLRCWTVTESAITETSTNVVLNSSDDQGYCGIALDLTTNYWWVFYAGKSDGSETHNTSTNLYCKCSTDSGATWGAETLLTLRPYLIRWLVTVPRRIGPPIVAFHNDQTFDELLVNVELSAPTAHFQMVS